MEDFKLLPLIYIWIYKLKTKLLGRFCINNFLEEKEFSIKNCFLVSMPPYKVFQLPISISAFLDHFIFFLPSYKSSYIPLVKEGQVWSGSSRGLDAHTTSEKNRDGKD